MRKKIKLIIFSFSIMVIYLFLFFPNVIQAREQNTEIENIKDFSILLTNKLGITEDYGKSTTRVTTNSSSNDSDLIVLNRHYNTYCMDKGGSLQRRKTRISAGKIWDERYIAFLNDANETNRIYWKFSTEDIPDDDYGWIPGAKDLLPTIN